VPTWKVRDKRAFLIAAMQELAGTAHISFEGDLSATTVPRLTGASGNETAVLKRNTLFPPQDFVVLPLEADLVRTIIAAIGGTVSRSILHIQIEKDGRLELGMYDSFDPAASFFGSRLTPEFFDRLSSNGILKEWVSR
jgi:hypothetical protein